ncbi:MAG: hypothetical protein KatS3mg002_0196 [Candidatus Woesearchaeota archaeon]|nr:MAG: hypothetical protein KatS3mg002_0196 [Candidatus Woesearchaeota archaeon]
MKKIKNLIIPAYLIYEILRNTIIPTATYAQDNSWDKKTRDEKIKALHTTENRIMPLIDSTKKEIITGLLDGHLFTPATKTMTLNYGDSLALDLTNFPTKKDATTKFKGVTFDEVFNFLYNGINKTYSSDKNTVMNKQQVLKNHKELERMVREFEVKDPKWNEYIQDGKITEKEFKELKEGIYAVEISAIDKKGKTIERGYLFITRGEDNSGKLRQIILREPPKKEKTITKVIYRDTTRESKENIEIGIGAGIIYEGNNRKNIPQGRLSLILKNIFGGEIEINTYAGYRKFEEAEPDIIFQGPYGITTLHTNRESEIYNTGLDLLIGEDLKIGVGANNYTTTVLKKEAFDEILRDHTGNIVKESYNNLLKNEKIAKNCIRYGPRIAVKTGPIEFSAMADYKKHDKPSYGLNLIFKILRK